MTDYMSRTDTVKEDGRKRNASPPSESITWSALQDLRKLIVGAIAKTVWPYIAGFVLPRLVAFLAFGRAFVTSSHNILDGPVVAPHSILVVR